VTIPITEYLEKEADSHFSQDQLARSKRQREQRKDYSKRPIQKRYKWRAWKKLIKFLIILAVIYAGYQGYCYYISQSKKDIKTLFAEYASEEKLGNDYLILDKITRNDFELLQSYASSNKIKIKLLVARCLKKLHISKGFVILKKYLCKDPEKEVKLAAIEALESYKSIQTIDLLVNQLKKEKNKQVKGEIGKSLRILTGHIGNAANPDYWKQWWNNNRREFKEKFNNQ